MDHFIIRIKRLLLSGLLTFSLFPHRVYVMNYYPSVFWTPLNCRFNMNRPGYASSGRKEYYFQVKPQSYMYFVCPNIAVWQDKGTGSPHRDKMHENLIVVDKESYDSCSVKNMSSPQNRVLLRCDQGAEKIKYYQEIFSLYKAFHDAMTYSPGGHYYFISTSNGTLESLHKTSGGHCKTHYMKLHIYVCQHNETCEYKMPTCPFSKFEHESPETNPPSPTTMTTATKVPVGAQTGQFSTLSESLHLALHFTAAAIIVLLIVTLICVICSHRKKKPEESIAKEREYDSFPV